MNASNVTTQNLIVMGIIAITLSAILGSIVLISNDKQIPDAIIALGSAGLASLGTLAVGTAK